ncbi:MAG TPA: hypothetical protein VMV72_08345 [Verrucomicrobiae bacterium]|nr:hypothetical protein [Verrucomicrobiae bacterium]
MSQQYNKVEKRRRRTAYLKRIRARQKKSAPKAAPAAPTAPAAAPAS